MSHLVLIAEDEPEIAEILTAYLERAGMRVAHARNGQAALELHRSLKPSLILLDVQMPLLNGWQVLASVRAQHDTPVIMLTAMDQDVDKLTGLRIGADDYVVKPFNPAEVVARVEAVLRRSKATGSLLSKPKPLMRAGPFEIDLEQHTATVVIDGAGRPLDLTLTEFKLLAQMLRAPRRVFSRSELLEHCLPEGDTLERTIDSHVSKLRRKLEEAGLRGVPVSVRGVGYKLGTEG